MTGTVYCRWREIVDGIHGNCYCKKVPRVSGYAVSERWRVNGVETYPAQAEKFSPELHWIQEISPQDIPGT